MTAETDLIKLYSGRILELAADIPHHGRLASPQASVRKRSPHCGSTVTVDVVMRDGRVAGELPAGTTEEAVLALATGAAHEGDAA